MLHLDAVLSYWYDGLCATLFGSSHVALAWLPSGKIDIKSNLVIRISFRAASRKVNNSEVNRQSDSRTLRANFRRSTFAKSLI